MGTIIWLFLALVMLLGTPAMEIAGYWRATKPKPEPKSGAEALMGVFYAMMDPILVTVVRLLQVIAVWYVHSLASGSTANILALLLTANYIARGVYELRFQHGWKVISRTKAATWTATSLIEMGLVITLVIL